MTATIKVLTDARLDEEPAELLLEVYEAPHLEREKRMFAEYVQVDRAHTVMLAEQGILSRADAAKLLGALDRLLQLGVKNFPIDPRKGSLLLQIESWLVDQIGESAAGRMHTGRSRLAQGPAARRLYKRRNVLAIMDSMLELQRTTLRLAEEHQGALMPGYTCLQHAHPEVFGHYLLAFASKLSDDFDRLSEGYRRLNRNPLGAAGLSGTSWPIDRFRTSELLGFDQPLANSRIAREAYYAAEVAAGLSFTMSTLNDLATDLHLWSSTEFGFVETADAFCGTSSIFLQKKNPTGLEAIKFAAGGATGWLGTALATFRAEGTGDVVMHEVPVLDEAFAAVHGSLRLMNAILKTMKVKTDRMLRATQGTWATATNVADLLVRSANLSFREAHSLVARLVRNSLKAELAISQLEASHLDVAAQELGMASPGLDTHTIRETLDAGQFARTRSSYGGISQEQIENLLREVQAELERQGAWFSEHNGHVTAAAKTLAAAIQTQMA